jgi:hypothetical protein
VSQVTELITEAEFIKSNGSNYFTIQVIDEARAEIRTQVSLLVHSWPE